MTPPKPPPTCPKTLNYYPQLLPCVIHPDKDSFWFTRIPQAEIVSGAEGLKKLEAYDAADTATDLLLLHSSKHSGPLKSFECGY